MKKALNLSTYMLDDALQLAENGEYQKALKLFLKLKSFYNAALCYNNLGNRMLHDKRYKKAIYYYKKALVFKEINHIVLDNMGTCYRELGNISKAIRLYKKSLNENKNYNLVKINLESTFMKICDWESLEHYKKVFKLSQKTPFLSIITQDSPGRNLEAAKKWKSV